MTLADRLSRLSPIKDEQGNILRMLSRGTSYTAAITLVSVPVLQVFALNKGIGEAELGTIRLFVQLGTILGYLLFMNYVNKIPSQSLVKNNSIAHLAAAVLPLFLIGLALFSPMLSTTTFMALYTVGWTLSGFLMSGHLVILSRLESQLFASPIFGRVYGMAGIAYYLVSMALAAGVKIVLTWGSRGFPPIFITSFVLVLVSSYASKGFRIVKTDPPPMAKQHRKRGVFSEKPQKAVVIIIFMHALRGLMSGIAFFFVPVALKNFDLLPSDAGTVSLLYSAGFLVGYLLIFRSYDEIGPARTTLLGAALQILPFLILVLSSSRLSFFTFYFIFSLGDVLIAQGVPLGILQTIPSTKIGTVTALRLVAMQSADALTALGIGAVVLENFFFFAGLYCLSAILVAFFAYLSFSPQKQKYRGQKRQRTV